jgi:hypothetical protein
MAGMAHCWDDGKQDKAYINRNEYDPVEWIVFADFYSTPCDLNMSPPLFRPHFIPTLTPSPPEGHRCRLSPLMRGEGSRPSRN